MTQSRKLLANVHVQMNVNAFHLPFHVQKPFGIFRRVLGNCGTRTDFVCSLGYNAQIHNRFIHVGLPVIQRRLKFIGESQTQTKEFTSGYQRSRIAGGYVCVFKRYHNRSAWFKVSK